MSVPNAVVFDFQEGVWRFRASPVECEALQFLTPNHPTNGLESLRDWGVTIQDTLIDNVYSIWNATSRDWNPVKPGDFIVKDSKGNFYPCDPEVMFHKYIRLGPVYHGEVPEDESL